MLPEFPDGPGGGESLDHLVGPWHILQLARGHRFSTDDLVTAWLAWRHRPDARTLLDIGSGIGTVGLCTLRKLVETEGPGATRPRHEWPHLTTVEAQPVSLGLQRRTVRLNGLCDVVRPLHGDLRAPPLDADARFDLITGSPPYFPADSALLSPHTQKAHARIELRGDVFDYAATAKRHLAPGGRFVFVMLAQDDRTEAAPLAHGLQVVHRLDVVFAAGRPPHVCVLVCGHDDELEGVERTTESITIRGEDGEWTEDYLAFRRMFRWTRESALSE